MHSFSEQGDSRGTGSHTRARRCKLVQQGNNTVRAWGSQNKSLGWITDCTPLGAAAPPFCLCLGLLYNSFQLHNFLVLVSRRSPECTSTHEVVNTWAIRVWEGWGELGGWGGVRAAAAHPPHCLELCREGSLCLNPTKCLLIPLSQQSPACIHGGFRPRFPSCLKAVESCRVAQGGRKGQFIKGGI